MTTASIELIENLEMQTRDGVTLRTDIYRPAAPGRYPVVLVRTPYDKTSYPTSIGGGSLHPIAAARARFVFAIQDARGRFGSEGTYDMLANTDGPDGADTIEWLAEQEWSSGAVGMIGPSACALAQFTAAMEQPPSLRAILPERAARGSGRGALMLDSALISWGAMQAVDRIQKGLAAGTNSFEDLGAALEAFRDPQSQARHLPLNEMPFMRAAGLDSFEEIVNLMVGSVPPVDPARFTVPMMLTSGWYDLAADEVSDLFAGVRTSAATPIARTSSQVLFGPWEHGVLSAVVGERFFGNHAAPRFATFSLVDRELAFLNKWLRGGNADLPTATYFVMGANEWREAEDWPPPGTTVRAMHLRSAGHAASRDGDGTLAWDAPSAEEEPDEFSYDPMRPVPAFGGRFFFLGGNPPGPFDQTRVETRPDVLVYTSDPVTEALEIAGPIRLRLHAATSAVDTDFVAKLCDVDPDGLSHNLVDGIVRARWRNGAGRTDLLEPGRPYEFTLSLGAVAHRFRPGHRLRLQVTSSAFSGYDRNMNTGAPLGSDRVGIVATQTIFHDATRPSAVLLPVSTT